MYDIKPLEEKWERYNRKRRKPFYLYTLLFIVLVGIGAFLFLNQALILEKFKESTSVKKSNAASSPVILDSALDTLALKNTDKNTHSIILQTQKKPVTENDNNPMEPGDVFIEVSDAGSVEETSVSRKKPKKKLQIEVTEISYSSYKAIEERFAESPDSDDSLFLARGYYKKKNYSKAAYWALQTNKIDGGIEESWLIFARSKAKIGQKNEALRVLSEYVKKSNSAEAMKLLNTLKK